MDISEDLRPLIFLIFKKLDIEIESSLRIAGKSDLTIRDYYEKFYKLKFISRLNQRKAGKFNYHADLLDFFGGTAAQLKLELHDSEYMHGRYIILTRNEINKLPSTVLTALIAYPRGHKKPTLLNAFSETDLNRLIGDKLDVSKNRLIQLMKDAITKCGSGITYDIYGITPSGYNYRQFDLQHLEPISQLSTDSDLEIIAKELLKEAFENNRLVVIGDEFGHFIYGFTKQGFLTPKQLWSSDGYGIYAYNKVFSSVFYSGSNGYLDLQLLKAQLNKWWVRTWSQVKSYFPVEIWCDFWFYGDLFKPHFK